MMVASPTPQFLQAGGGGVKKGYAINYITYATD